MNENSEVSSYPAEDTQQHRKGQNAGSKTDKNGEGVGKVEIESSIIDGKKKDYNLFLDVKGCLILSDRNFNIELAEAVENWYSSKIKANVSDSDIRIVVWSTSLPEAEIAGEWLSEYLDKEIVIREKTYINMRVLVPGDIFVDDDATLVKLAEMLGISAMYPDDFIRYSMIE